MMKDAQAGAKKKRAPRRSAVQVMLAKRAKEVEKRAKEEAKKAKEQQNARQTALKNAVTMMKDAQAGAAKKKRAPRRSAVQVMLAKRAKEAEKRAKEEAKKAKEQQKARQTALKNATKAMKDAQAGAKKKRAPRRSAVQVMLAKRAKEVEKRA